MEGQDKNRNREEAELLEQLEDGENKGGVLGQGRIVDSKVLREQREVYQYCKFNALLMC